MSTLDQLPPNILLRIVQHLDSRPTASARPSAYRKDMLSLATASKTLRSILFERDWVDQHVMGFTKDKVEKTRKALKLSMRRKVKSLVLTGNTDGQSSRPTLKEYIELFPNVSSIYIDLVYPQPPSSNQCHATPKRHAQKNGSANTSSTPSSPPKVSLSIVKADGFYGTKHEQYVTKFLKQINASLEPAKIMQLDYYHLDFATSRTKSDRESRSFWSDFGKRIISACIVPAKEVSLEVGEIRINGEVIKFLDALVIAIKGWPKGIQSISFQFPTDDFSSDRENEAKFKLDKKGRIALVSGWIPTEKDMDTFITKIRKDQSKLQSFSLVIHARNGCFVSSARVAKPIFEFSYTKCKPMKVAKKTGSSTSGTRNDPIDVEDFSSKAATKKPKAGIDPECNTAVHQAVIQELYDAMTESKEMGLDGSESGSYDSLEEELEIREEMAEEMYGGGDEDDDPRPRWAAF